ncbi:sortase family enzyme [Frankia sp. EI5c]|uniref:class F sortase n=1 Tax=Frankia sp. EI5c TaxID=683316 RepID=UPI0007C270E7|nr:class F sortase [Frankia sp. EI5c]OAA22273.1 sortase family enzyme [Frankia sp. EI5c]
MEHGQSADPGESPLTTRRTAAAAAVLGTLALVGVVLVILGWPPGSVPTAAPLPEADGPDVPGPQPSVGGAGARRFPPHQPDLPASSIRIPALGVTASIGMATEEDGILIPPSTPTEVGLWSGSAALDAGSGEVTIVGHVNWRGMPPFAFGNLARLHRGDLVFTSDPHGRQTAWRVLRIFARPKTRGVDPTAFAGPRGPRQLFLITCGGSFDVRAGSYSDNVYVRAVPA